MQHVENELDITLEKLTATAIKLDEKLKAYALAEGEVRVERNHHNEGTLGGFRTEGFY